MTQQLGTTDGVWHRYDVWNDAVAEVLFPVLEVPEPVYLDMEDDELTQLASRVGVSEAEVEAELAAAVAATIGGTRRTAFRRHSARLAEWRRSDRSEAPPVLALLAVLSLAAERMANGEGLTSNNFYGRLREILGRHKNDQEIVAAYRDVAERYWGALNAWLNEWNGRRGLPTAYTLGHRFVGLPISQALVRKGDRVRLVNFFLKFGFSPGSDVPPAELEPILDLWMREHPCPATRNLERLWRSAESRSRIAQAASVALSSWDGRVSGSTPGAERQSGRVVLSLEMGSFPSKRFGLQVLVYADSPETERQVAVETARGQLTSMLAPVGSGALGLGRSAQFDASNLLGGQLVLRDSLTGLEIVRRPKRLQAFRQDPLSMRWLEIERVMLGDDVRLLAHESIEARLMQVLERIARPGWSKVTEGYTGLPDGWVVLSGVEVLAPPGGLVKVNGVDDLSPLVPLTTSQVKLSGGLSLPGAVRGKWHSWAPPEIRAVSDTPDGFVVRLFDLTVDDLTEEATDGALLDEWGDEGTGVVVRDLAEEDLADGDYRVELVPCGATNPLTTTHMRLRSGDTPDLVQWRRTRTVAYVLDTPLGALGAGDGEAGTGVRGAVPVGGRRALVNFALPTRPWWGQTRTTARPSMETRIQLANVDPSSCVFTGRHREQVDYVPVSPKTGKPLVPYSTSRCTSCGLVRRYSTSFWKTRRREGGSSTVRPTQPEFTVRVDSLEPVRAHDVASWDLVLDGVFHTGGGPWSLLERLAMHIDASGLFADTFARSLECLGHIDVRRDPETLRPVEWEASPTALAATPAGYFLAGYWPSSLTEVATEQVAACGGRPSVVDTPEGPKSWYFTGLTEADAMSLSEVAVSTEAWRDLAASLPPISDVVEALPRRVEALDGNISRFDLAHAQWVDARDVSMPGAYRVSRFATLDIVRTPIDVELGTMAASTVHLSKHVAAWLEGRPLISYDPASQELVVPLGADLPGLYGRAAVLCSGMLPQVRGRLLLYSSVPPELAGHLGHLMTS